MSRVPHEIFTARIKENSLLTIATDCSPCPWRYFAGGVYMRSNDQGEGNEHKCNM